MRSVIGAAAAGFAGGFVSPGFAVRNTGAALSAIGNTTMGGGIGMAGAGLGYEIDQF